MEQKKVAIIAAVIAAVAVSIAVVAVNQPSPTDLEAEISQPSPTELEAEMSQPVEEDKIVIIASFFPYYEFARNVAGDAATVEQFIPPGVPAHDWDPQPSKVALLQDTDVFVYNGLGMEAYIDDLLGSDDYDHIAFVQATEGITPIQTEDHHHHHDHGHDEDEHGHDEDEHGHEDERENGHDEDEHGHEDERENGHDEDEHGHDEDEREHGHEDEGHGKDEHGHDEDEHGHEDEHMDGEHNLVDDPHMWLDPILVKEQVNNIRNELVIVDPKNAETYVSNAAAYNDLIDELDASFRSEFAECQTNVFVPFHAAFGYLADRYGLEEFALGGLAPDAEASAADIVEFVEFVEENDVKVVFSERLIDPRLAEVIAEEAGARVMVLDVIEGVDELGVDTYIDKMRQNLAALSEAMGCQ